MILVRRDIELSENIFRVVSPSSETLLSQSDFIFSRPPTAGFNKVLMHRPRFCANWQKPTELFPIKISSSAAIPFKMSFRIHEINLGAGMSKVRRYSQARPDQDENL